MTYGTVSGVPWHDYTTVYPIPSEPFRYQVRITSSLLSEVPSTASFLVSDSLRPCNLSCVGADCWVGPSPAEGPSTDPVT